MQRSGAEAYAAQGVDRLVVGTTSTELNEQLRQLEAFATFTACDAERPVPERADTRGLLVCYVTKPAVSIERACSGFWPPWA